jgi:hypothetical protein
MPAWLTAQWRGIVDFDDHRGRGDLIAPIQRERQGVHLADDRECTLMMVAEART